MKIVGDTVVFSSGRERHANCGIIGLSPKETITGGYDGVFWSREQEEWQDDEDRLTPAELIELADYMIERWQAFKSTLPTDKRSE